MKSGLATRDYPEIEVILTWLTTDLGSAVVNVIPVPMPLTVYLDFWLVRSEKVNLQPSLSSACGRKAIFHYWYSCTERRYWEFDVLAKHRLSRHICNIYGLFSLPWHNNFCFALVWLLAMPQNAIDRRQQLERRWPYFTFKNTQKYV